MTNKPMVGGTIFNQQVVRAVNANQAAREALRRIIDENPGPQSMAFLVAKAANALGENLAAIRELERIASEFSESRRKQERKYG